MTNKIKIINSNWFIITAYTALNFIFYFLLPWIQNRTIYFFRWDEATYFYIYQKIFETGFIPHQLNYIGGISNYIYPLLYLSLSTIFSLLNSPLDLQIASLVLQSVLFLTICISSLIIYKITWLMTSRSIIAFLAGLFYITLPILSYRLFYLNATFYANFIGILFLLLFFYYLLQFKKEQKISFLILSILFYSITLFTHQLVFMMASIILGIDFLIEVVVERRLFANIKEKVLYIMAALIFNLGYILKIPLFNKILSILHIAKYSEFGKEQVTKVSVGALPPLLPDIIIWASITAILIIFLKRKKSLYRIALFHAFLVSPIFLSKLNIYPPAYFRYDSFYIITVPILLSYLISLINRIRLQILVIALIISYFTIRTSSILNGFYFNELSSLGIGLKSLNCSNTVSYFRIAPWIPVVSNSTNYFAEVDIYNDHADKMAKDLTMMSSQVDMKQRISMIKKEKIDCIIYEKNILIVDGFRIKGWEKSRYSDLYNISKKHYEDNNLVVFKFKTF